jgi:hypothetical protein
MQYKDMLRFQMRPRKKILALLDRTTRLQPAVSPVLGFLADKKF